MRRHSILALARSASRELFTNNRYYEIASQPPKGASWPMWEAIRYVTDIGPDAVNGIITGHHYRSHRMFSSGEVPLGVVPPNKRGSPLDDKDQRQAAGGHQNPQPLPSDGTIEITTSTSFQSLLQLSATVPVVLDAYAPWCAPCKQLDPILKQIASTLAGKVVLAKLNIENEGVQSLVQSLQIASVPTLFMIMQGRIVDVVHGVPPPAELQSWVAKAVSVMATIRSAEDERPKLNENAAADPKAQLGAGYEALRTSGTRSQNIAPQFADILDSASALPEHKAAATAGLAICAVLEGNLETAAELVASATALAGKTASEDVSAAEAWLDLAKEAATALKNQSRTAEEIESHMLANKKDASAAYLLALKLFQDVRLSEAVDAALQIVRRDREWQDQAGRRVVTALCHVLGSSSEGAKAARRRLSNLWFL